MKTRTKVIIGVVAALAVVGAGAGIAVSASAPEEATVLTESAQVRDVDVTVAAIVWSTITKHVILGDDGCLPRFGGPTGGERRGHKTRLAIATEIVSPRRGRYGERVGAEGESCRVSDSCQLIVISQLWQMS